MNDKRDDVEAREDDDVEARAEEGRGASDDADQGTEGDVSCGGEKDRRDDQGGDLHEKGVLVVGALRGPGARGPPEDFGCSARRSVSEVLKLESWMSTLCRKSERTCGADCEDIACPSFLANALE